MTTTYCGRCGRSSPGHYRSCPSMPSDNETPDGPLAAAFVEQTARIEAEAHADLRTQFALAVVRSGMSLSMNVEGGPVPSRPMNTVEWAHTVYNVADALTAESARRRKAEGL